MTYPDPRPPGRSCRRGRGRAARLEPAGGASAPTTKPTTQFITVKIKTLLSRPPPKQTLI